MENFEGIRLPWPDWKIVRYIGGGGYGKVYEIERNTAGILEKAAVKIIARPKDESELDDYYDNGYDRETAVTSFESELRSYAKEYQLMKELQGQSNIVSCDDFALVPNANGIGGQIFLRMELLISLQQVLRERTLSEKEVIKLGKDISHALMLCESKKIVHRDIKPQNILLSQFGDYKLGDFGVSKVMDHATYATLQGTPGFHAPEVEHGEKYGHRADIYSLGITLYWLLNNRKMPFIGAEEKLTMERKEEARKRRYRGEQLPAPKNGSAELKQVVLKACAYRPEDRYASARELYQALEGVESSKAKTVKSVSASAGKTAVGMRGVSENSWEETTQTVGAYKTAGATAQKSAMYEEEQTGGESWGTTAGTIGAPKKAAKQQTSHRQEPEEEKTMGAKQAYQKPQKAESKEEQTTAKEAQVATEEKAEKSTIEDCILIQLFLSLSCLFAIFPNWKWITRHFSNGVKNARTEFMFGKAMIEIGTAAIILFGLVIAIMVVNKKIKKKTRKILDMVYICDLFLFGAAVIYENYYIFKNQLDPGEKPISIGLIIMLILIIYMIFSAVGGLRRIDSSTK